jgi:heptosyltransferase-2
MSAPSRILIVRLDRIGDVVLSLPVAQALRAAYPEAFLAMLVQSACRELVEGHPDLDTTLVCDKSLTWRQTWQWAQHLREFRFDTALVLHPTLRSHAIVWAAGIPRRIGYGRKGGWLLTRRLLHRKQEGRRHEADYALDFIRALGAPDEPPRPSIPVSRQAAEQVGALLRERGVRSDEPLVAIHPSASCPSKRWMPERFAAVAEALAEQAEARILLIAGPGDLAQAQAVERAMQRPAVNLAGTLSIGQTAELLARCRLLISNDSGPVHLAAAVRTPVVAIFGRNQPGLGPRRRRPLGDGHAVLQKDVGCTECLAHRCRINFLCLGALSVDEVLEAARGILTARGALAAGRR